MALSCWNNILLASVFWCNLSLCRQFLPIQRRYQVDIEFPSRNGTLSMDPADPGESTNTSLRIRNGSGCGVTYQFEQATFTYPYSLLDTSVSSCNAYGPVCQPGTIDLGVGIDHCSILPTTMPCSSLLASQSLYLSRDQRILEALPISVPPDSWGRKFGRSSQCRSWANLIRAHSPTGSFKLNQCTGDAVAVNVSFSPFFNGAKTINEPQVSLLPPGIVHRPAKGTLWDSFYCCGNCSIDLSEVELYYFEDESATEYCHSLRRAIFTPNNTLNSDSNTLNLSRTIGEPPFVRTSKGSLAVVSGHTLYVSI